MLPINFIIDRTKKDVDRAKHLNAKIANRTATAAEKAEWLSGLKGSYNYTDLNRVESAVSDLASYLGVMVETKTNWTERDEINGNNMYRFVSNLQEVKKRYFATTSIPETMSGFSYEAANNIEKMLMEAYENKNSMALWRKSTATVKNVREYTRVYDDPIIGTTGADWGTSWHDGRVPACKTDTFTTSGGFKDAETNASGEPIYFDASEVVGMYTSNSDNSELRKITSKPYFDGSTDSIIVNGVQRIYYYYEYEYEVVGYATYETVLEYIPGSLIGCLLLPYGELPNGTLIEGSLAEGYCYVQEADGKYYYYELR